MNFGKQLLFSDFIIIIIIIITAPWSNLTENAASTAANSSLTLAEIQKAERERRAEQYRIELAQQQTQALLEQQQQKDAVLKWKLKPQNQAKSLAEIQAEESKARQTIQQTTAVNVCDNSIMLEYNST